METLKETIKQTGTLFTLSDVTKLLRDNSDIKEMEYKYLYFFRKSDGYMYDLVNKCVGDFLAYYTPLFKFKEFVISHHAYRIYEMSDDYFEEIDKYVNFLKNIRAVIGDIKFKSVKHLLTVLRDAEIESYGQCELDCKANAALIAAAPEMYKELERHCWSCMWRRPSCEECETRKILRKVRGEE